MKLIVKKLFRKFKLDIYRLNTSTNASYQLLKGLQKFNIDIVFDIGANRGQFAQELRSVGFSGRIVSFEPLSVAYTQLKHSAKSDKLWSLHDRGAIGDFNGEIKINISGNSVSSSLLPMLEAHISAASGSSYIASETTPIQKLDTAAPQYLSGSSNLFVKIDTQGYEWQVLDGGFETIKLARGILLEVSLVPLYDGQRLWREILERLESAGFTLWALQPGFIDPRSGATLQMDAILFRI